MPAPPASGLSPILSATLPLSGHAIGLFGVGSLAVSACLALTQSSLAGLILLMVSAAIGLPATTLYGLTLWRMIRHRPLTLSLRADNDSLVLQISSGSRPLRQIRYPFTSISDCGLTPVDSGFSSLWRPYLGLGDPVRRTALPLGCRTDLRRLPPAHFEALLDQIVAVLEVHYPQALQRLRQRGAAYG